MHLNKGISQPCLRCSKYHGGGNTAKVLTFMELTLQLPGNDKEANVEFEGDKCSGETNSEERDRVMMARQRDLHGEKQQP